MMAKTSLYEKLIRCPKSLSWKDIFSGWREKHSQKDADFAIIAGTTLDTAELEIGMLQKWQRPWLFYKVFLTGMAAFGLLLAAIVGMICIQGYCANGCLNLLLFVLPPCVVPVTLMVFFWEMNAPRNISLMELIASFFTGGILSIVVSLLLFSYIPNYEAYWAPLAEEPGKLIISVLLLRRLYQKKGQVFGLNGLTIGAAVGAGFAAFESTQYAYDAFIRGIGSMPISQLQMVNYAVNVAFTAHTLPPVLVNILLRGLFAIHSHVLFCAPYSCMAALYMEKGNPMPAFLKADFWGSFLLSGLVHGLWNRYNGQSMAVWFLLCSGILWYSCLFAVRRAFAQLSAGVTTVNQNTAGLTALRIQGIAGVHNGVGFALTKPEILIGSSSVCNLSYPVNTAGISPKHCKLILQQGQLYLADMGSQTGTYLNGQKLRPGTGHLLQKGDRFALGGNDQAFQIV